MHISKFYWSVSQLMDMRVFLQLVAWRENGGKPLTNPVMTYSIYVVYDTICLLTAIHQHWVQGADN